MTIDQDVKILFQNKDYLCAWKPAGMLSQSGKDQIHPDLLKLLEGKTKKKLHLLSRLDRPVSGLIMLSSSKKFSAYYQDIQKAGRIRKTYIAIVEGALEVENAEYTHYLYHDKKTYKARVEDQQSKGYSSATIKLNTIAKLDNYSIISIILESGKFHQIRAQLAHLGHAVKGDVKYGSRRSNKGKFIYLHAYQIDFTNKEGEKKSFNAPLPKNDTLWELVEQNLK
jgi:23S rRNA pseudouridine1911/1915/1917 synthase